jgi:hypothetical protein
VGVKFALLLAFPLLLVVTRFFRGGEWSALKAALPGRRQAADAR